MAWIATHQPCEKCDSSDAVAIDSSGWATCFANDCKYKVDLDNMEIKTERKPPAPLIPFGKFVEQKTRALTIETCEKFSYFVAKTSNGWVSVAPYRHGGNICAQKVRTKDKKMYSTGDMSNVELFGQHLWGDGGKRIIITEGEIDAMSLSQVQGHKWPVVSIPNGVKSAVKSLKNNIEFLSKFDEIVLMFDNDEAGRKAAIEASEVLPVGKVKIAELPLKDANDMLVAGRSEELIKAIWNAKEKTPAGIVAGKDMLDAILADKPVAEYQYPFDFMNRKLLGVYPKQITTLVSGSGMGKSQLTKEIAFSLMKQGATVGYIALEEGLEDTGLSMLSLEAGKRLHLLDNDKQELTDLFNKTLAKYDIYFYDHFGSHEGDSLLNKIRYMVVGLGCKYIFLDHISIMVSGVEEGDERRLIDNLMTKLRSLVQELGCGLFLVSHLKRPAGDKGHEDGARTSLAQLRGSAAIAQLSDNVIGIERDQHHETDSNISTIRVLKSRRIGESGVIGCLGFNKLTGRMTEVKGEFVNEGDKKL